MEMIKKLLAWAALACMAVFIVAVVVLTVSGTLQANFAWAGIPLTLFLLLGGCSLLIRWTQQQIAEKKAAAEKAAEKQETEEEKLS